MTHRARSTTLVAASVFLFVIASTPATFAAQAPATLQSFSSAVTFRAYDRPSDDGSTLAVEWTPCDAEAPDRFYIVEIASEEDFAKGEFKQAARVPSMASLRSAAPRYFGFAAANKHLHYVGVEPARIYKPDAKKLRAQLVEEETKRLAPGVEPGKTFDAFIAKLLSKRLAAERRAINARPYHFRIALTDGQDTVLLQSDGKPTVVTGRARPNYFKGFKLNNLVFSVAFCAIVAAFIHLARRNPDLFIRKIAGLDAVEEAIGRATEMGRSAFFVHGLTGMGSLSTIASVNILGRVARRAAEYDTRVRVMNRDPIVMAVSQEVVKQSYTEAGRPDAYSDDDVALVAYDQFSYVAAVGGRMLRERPAAIFLMGYFYAESLLLSETGASTGAIQIAGTDSYTQIPFFVTTCDYTLIGEELYAASAYLSREPRMLGSLRGQDVGKAFMMAVLVVFALLATVGKIAEWDLWWIQSLFQPF